MAATPLPSEPTRSDAPRRRGLVQAPVRPLDPEGVQIALVGTACWVVALVLVSTVVDVASWWRWVCVAGVALGLVGAAYCLRRRGRTARPAP